MPDHYKPFKMKGFSGFGEGTSPMKGYKSDAQRRAVHASKADGGAGNPNKMHKTMYNESPVKAAKPDYIDLDGDGNKTESMKKAAMDKKKGAPTKMYGKSKAPSKMGHKMDKPAKMKHGKDDKPMKMYGKKAAPKMKHGDKPMKMKHDDKPMKMGHKSKPAKMGHKSAPTKNYKKGYYGA